MKRNVMLSVVALTGSLAFAEVQTNSWKVAAERVNDWDWTESGNFTLGAVADGAVVEIPEGETVRLLESDADSVARVQAISRIRPMADSSTLVLEAETGRDLYVPCIISRQASSANGWIIKRGAGDVWLQAGAKGDLLRCNMVVEEGGLHLPTDAATNLQIDSLAVSNNAVFYTAERVGTDGTPSTTIWQLWGEGVVTNRSAKEHHFRVNGGTAKKPCVFSGTFGGGVRYYSGGHVRLTGAGSTSGSSSAVYNGGRTSFVRLGNDGEPSSIGRSGLTFGEYGGTWAYEGPGEVSDKSINARFPGQGPMILDAGAGGLVFNGGFAANTQTTIKGRLGMGVLELTGTNDLQASAINGLLNTYGVSDFGETGAVHVVKSGSGIWAIGHGRSKSRTGVTIKEGTLRVGSIAERGHESSIGKGDDPMEAYCGAYDESRRVDWSIALGTPQSEGTLELGDGAGILSTTRPLALFGDGRFRNDGTAPFRFANVRPEGGARKLTLCGSGTSGENILGEVFDSAANPVSLVKEGSGEWTLSMTNSFHGDLTVKAGTLRVGNSSGRFSWWRWTCKQCLSPTSKTVQLDEFALFGADYHRLNITNGTEEANWSQCSYYPAIRPGQLAYCVGYETSADAPDLLALVDIHPKAVGWNYAAGRKLVMDDPSSWVSVVMRLTNGTPEVASYDFACRYGTGDANSTRDPAAWMLEGSADGLHWFKVHEVDNVNTPEAERTMYARSSNVAFYKTGSSFYNGTPPPAVYDKKAQKIAGSTNLTVNALADVRSVSVAAGATLKADVPGQVLGGLTVDAKGAGTVDGFGLAENGVLEVVNLDPNATLELPIAFTNTEDADLSGWSVKVGGRIRPSWSARMKNGRITLERPGILLIVR